MTIQYVEKCQSVMKKQIRKALLNDDKERCLKLIDNYADFNHRINNILRDDEIEHYLKTIASAYPLYSPRNGLDSNTIIFYDQIGTSICLGLQYLRGLIKNNYNVVYIYEGWSHDIEDRLLSEIVSYNIEYRIFDSRYSYYKDGLFLGDEIRHFILNTKASKIILHPDAPGALGASVLYSLNDVMIYRIVPGDHHFYVGYDFVNRFIEFRPFGVKTAIEDRRIPLSKISYLPYYPIININSKFLGFPVETEGKIVVLTAGARYKFLGSNLFFTQCKRVLTHDNTIIFYCGKPFRELEEFVNRHKYKNRLIILGYRRDFVECVKRCDMLLNSYPFPGGLICQTAAFFRKPIIAYSKPDDFLMYNVDDLLGERLPCVLTNTDEGKMYEYIDKLVLDNSFRKDEGAKAFESLQKEEVFNHNLNEILRGDDNHTPNEPKDIFNRQSMVDWYAHINHRDIVIPLFLGYGWKAFVYFGLMSILRRASVVYCIKYILIHYLLKMQNVFIKRIAYKLTGRKI